MGFLSMWSYFVLESHCQLDSLLPTKSQCMLSLEEPDKNSRTKYNHHHYWKKKLPLNPTCAKVPKHRYIWQSNNHWLTLIQNTWHIKRADGLTDLNYYFSLLVKPWVNSLKKILMLGKIEGRRRRGADRGWEWDYFNFFLQCHQNLNIKFNKYSSRIRTWSLRIMLITFPLGQI